MENQIILTIQSIINHWALQGISSGNTYDFNYLSKNVRKLIEINDFNLFYSLANGMAGLYPNGMDENGFLIYPIQNIKLMKYFNEDIFIFSDYLQKCWWYGIRILNEGNYEIGIIREIGKFEKTHDSLDNFLCCYLHDCDYLY